jgi:mannosyltransferase OCH1-like enzyme
MKKCGKQMTSTNINVIPTTLDARITSTTFQKIPRVIYQTFKSYTISDNLYEGVKSFIDLNPEYRYEFYDDERMFEYVVNYDCKNFSFTNEELIKAFNAIAVPAGKADLWRYLIIYERGGVYVDIDTKCVKPLNTFINLNDDIVTYIVGDVHNYYDKNLKWKHLFPQWMLMYSPKCTILKCIIEECVKAINTKTPVPDSEECKNMLERYTGVCISNYIYRSIFNFKNVEQESRLKCGIYNIKHNQSNYQLNILPSTPNIFNDAIINKNFDTIENYKNELLKNNATYWVNQRKIFND